MPVQSLKPMSSSRSDLAWPVFFLLAAVQAFVALFVLLSIPADPKGAIWLGYSLNRLIIALFTLLLAAACALLAYRCWRAPGFQTRRLGALFSSSRRYRLSSSLALVAALLSWVAILALANGRYVAYYERLAPLLLWGLVTALELFAWLTVAWYGLHRQRLAGYKPLLLLSLAIFAAVVIVWACIAWSGVGITPQTRFWGRRGVPLLSWQVGLAWLFTWLAWGFFSGLPEKLRERKLFLLRRPDLIVAILLWLAASLLWGSYQPKYKLHPPAYETYPSSDANLYDTTAQSILTGNGYLGEEVPPRPLYILFLAGMHAVSGASLLKTIALQGALLAVFPIGLYLLGSKLHSRPAGLLAALLGILREYNAISATPFGMTSNSKMLMTDFPMAVAVCFAALGFVHWLQNRSSRRRLALFAGGVCGAIVLVRVQFLLCVPFLLLLAFPVYEKRWRSYLAALALFGIGFGLVISPWVARNYAKTGTLILDSPQQAGTLYRRFMPDDQIEESKPEAGEDQASYFKRMLQNAMQLYLNNLGRNTAVALAHFNNNLMGTALMLPYQTSLSDYRDNLVVSTYFWHPYTPELTPQNIALLGFNLFVFSLGVAAAWRHGRWPGLIPLVIFLSYNLSNAAVITSGYRYILPADWPIYFYFALGAAQIIAACAQALGRAFHSSVPALTEIIAEPPRKLLLTAAGLLLFGSLLPLSEVVIPNRYPQQEPAALAARLAALPSVQQAHISGEQLARFAGDPQAVIQWGRALYPRHYAAGRGTDKKPLAYQPKDYERAAFQVVNADLTDFIIQMPMPAYFPNAADVIIAGCRDGNTVDGWLVVILGEQETLYTTSAGFTGQCPIRHPAVSPSPGTPAP